MGENLDDAAIAALTVDHCAAGCAIFSDRMVRKSRHLSETTANGLAVANLLALHCR